MALERVDRTQLRSYDIIASLYRLLGNPVRLRILRLLESKSMAFGELMRDLAVNPKILSGHLNKLIEFRLVAKSYPHSVYVLTSPGRRIFREQIEGAYDYVDLLVKPAKEE